MISQTVIVFVAVLSAVKTNAAPLSTRAVGNFEPYGCYSEGAIKYHRALGKASFVDAANMTVKTCTTFCDGKGFTLAGLEYAKECWCGNKIEFENVPIASEKCNMKCPGGNGTETCGGPDAISVWSSSGQPVLSHPVTQITGLPEGCKYVGCHQDNLQQRALPARGSYEGKMTPAACAAACLAQNNTFAGSEYSWECYCGNYVHYDAAEQSQCFVPCEGNDSLICGGEGVLSLYHCPRPTTFQYFGCYSEGVIPDHRALDKSGFSDPIGMTVQLCTEYCGNKGYALAGLEYGQECWCGNKIEFNNGPIDASKCDMPCVGFSYENCGGRNAISVWSSKGAPIVAHPVPQKAGLPGQCQYVGCHKDDVKARALPERASYDGLMTPSKCASACLAKGYTISGVEYSWECYCGNSLKYGHVEESKCFMPCEGNDELICGGEANLAIYNCPSTTPKFEHFGCYTDSAIQYHRALNKAGFVNTTSMTIESCTSFCAFKNFTLAGLEFGQECWCGNKIEFANGPTEPSNCDTPCVGFAEESCGGPKALDVWGSTGRPVVSKPTPQTSGLPSGCVYSGCHHDNVQERALSERAQYPGLLTPALCVETCLSKGFKYAGMEYGFECYCGQSVLYDPEDSSLCFTPCEGNDGLLCGGDVNLSLYNCTLAVAN
ncbi:WSC domain-containing protein [Cladochytrium replicatum]|nr:WSC domain-containing protein [Cladochytrium replicatum]